MPRDPAALTVVKEKIIPAVVGEVWRHLTDGALLAGWFADTEGLRPGESSSSAEAWGHGVFSSNQILFAAGVAYTSIVAMSAATLGGRELMQTR